MNEEQFMKKYGTKRTKGLLLRGVLCDMVYICKLREGKCTDEDGECGFMPLCTFRPQTDDPVRCWAEIVKTEHAING